LAAFIHALFSSRLLHLAIRTDGVPATAAVAHIEVFCLRRPSRQVIVISSIVALAMAIVLVTVGIIVV
jgi:hypothetical protein